MMAGSDNRKKFAIGAAVVVLLLLAGRAVWQWSERNRPVPAVAAMPAEPSAKAANPPAVAASAVGEAAQVVPGGLLIFDSTTGKLPPEALDLLARVAEAARSTEGAMVEISGFFPAAGDPAVNERFARLRAESVRHALEANGVAVQRMRIATSAALPGDDARAATRIELRVR